MKSVAEISQSQEWYSMWLRWLLAALILLSILINFHVFVVQKDYEILTNPNGPDTSDYSAE